MSLFRVYSQYLASGDVTDIKDFGNIFDAEDEFDRRCEECPKMYHAMVDVMAEHEAMF